MHVLRRGAHRHGCLRQSLLAAALSVAIFGGSTAMAQSPPAASGGVAFHIAAGPLDQALHQFNTQSGLQVLFDPALVTGRKSAGVNATVSTHAALDDLLKGSGLSYQFTDGQTVVIKRASKPTAAKPKSSTQANGPDASNATQLDTVTVTAEKKTENIQKVPIAISAFSGQDLDDKKIETGADLVTSTPNVSFTKTNFASYNFQIRGIGTQALSVTTDPAVAVSFNDTPLIRNRLFEQEYFDVDNVEVLRGPQGTLYGRNATAGVVNMIPNLPSFDGFESWVKTEVGNYDGRRFSGMLNVPVSSTLAFRLAGAWTDRDGYDYNSVTNNNVNGRNLWSGRASLAWKPSDDISASLVWEHFSEHDDRSRTGKQLCHTDPGPTEVDGVAVTNPLDQATLSQGCTDGSLYGQSAFGVPNGLSLPEVLTGNALTAVGIAPDFSRFLSLLNGNPYAGVTQSTNLRTIATTFDPIFNAKNDVVQFNFQANLSPGLKFVSQTLFTRDSYFSEQDYDRFPSVSVFSNTLGGFDTFGNPLSESTYPGLTPNGVFVDPQLGASTQMLAVDRSQSYSHQWSQEFRLQSDFDGPFNFNIGANFLDFHINENYYVFNNVFTAIAEGQYNLGNGFPGQPPQPCAQGSTTGCIYIDPNSLNNINGQGHNYFRSDNIASTLSTAIFGETYWKLANDLKLTVGLRLTQDRKNTTPVPSQLLLAPNGPEQMIGAGYVNYGYPASSNINQEWTEPTGRVVLDWAPRLSFTDSTLLYASYSRGYVAGGTNSPGIGNDPTLLSITPNPTTFKPEFVNAYEFGTKNVLTGGKFSLDADVFYYDYRNYQVSQIDNRGSLNENFNAKTWGAEFQAAWQLTRNFRADMNLGLLGTRISSHQYSIDQMNLTDGNPDWVTVKPFVQAAQSCIAPAADVAQLLQVLPGLIGPGNSIYGYLAGLCTTTSPVIQGGYLAGSQYSQQTGVVYDPRTAPNGGAGISTNVGGNELPNAPHSTFNLGAQYTFFLGNSDLVLRADYYHQSSSWARVYNDPIDYMRGWSNANISLTYEHPENDLTVQFYVKNLFDKTPITGTFLNSSDSGLTTNVFTLDPRIIGLSIRKGFY
jgi:iron complex outermembrane receptor protein